MPIYTILQISGPDAAKNRRRITCQTDSEALRVAQQMANAGFTLGVWRGNEAVGTVMAAQNAATS